MIAALYVQADGCYGNLAGVDPWPEARDARLYNGPHPVVAHPPCERWGKFATGSTRKPGQFQVGADDGKFSAALSAVRRFGGILEHPALSKAWPAFGLTAPPSGGGWIVADQFGGATCHVEQGHYGHFSRKPTWLYACGVIVPGLIWGPSPQRIHPRALELHGYEKARRIGVVAMVGGKHKKQIREATPIAFRDLLLSIASTAVLREAA